MSDCTAIYPAKTIECLRDAGHDGDHAGQDDAGFQVYWSKPNAAYVPASALDAANEALRAANERLAQTVDYAAKVDAELETLRADSARQLADAGVARAVHEYDQRVKSDKALRAANEEIARLRDLIANFDTRTDHYATDLKIAALAPKES